jgi:hypothetical protein
MSVVMTLNSDKTRTAFFAIVLVARLKRMFGWRVTLPVDREYPCRRIAVLRGQARQIGDLCGLRVSASDPKVRSKRLGWNDRRSKHDRDTLRQDFSDHRTRPCQAVHAAAARGRARANYRARN